MKQDITSNDRIVAAVDQYVGVDLGLVRDAYPPSSLEVYETPEAISGYSVLYNTLSKLPGHVNLPTSEIVVYTTTFERVDENEGRVILYDNDIQKYGCAVLTTTHGIWIMKLGVEFGRMFLREFAKHYEKDKFQPTAMDLAKSKAFQDFLKASKTTLKQFLTELRSKGGYVTGYWLMARTNAHGKPQNAVFFGALYYEIKRLAKLLEVMPQSGLPETVKLWTSKETRPEDPPAFISVVFYRKKTRAWNAMTFYGQELGIWYDSTKSVVQKANCDTSEMMSLWHNAIELYCDVNGVAWNLVLWTSVTPTTPVLRGIDLQHTPDFLPRTDKSNNQKTVNSVVVILLTTKGYWTVWIPSRLGYDAIDRIIARLTYDLGHGLQGASGISIITVALLKTRMETFSRGRFLGPLLQAMQVRTNRESS